nr:hypothetical protein [Acrocarpospora macrocephala]
MLPHIRYRPISVAPRRGAYQAMNTIIIALIIKFVTEVRATATMRKWCRRSSRRPSPMDANSGSRPFRRGNRLTREFGTVKTDTKISTGAIRKGATCCHPYRNPASGRAMSEPTWVLRSLEARNTVRPSPRTIGISAASARE